VKARSISSGVAIIEARRGKFRVRLLAGGRYRTLGSAETRDQAEALLRRHKDARR
jgi:hypothetical protein